MEDQVFQIQRMLADELDAYKENQYVDDNIQGNTRVVQE